MYRLQNYYRTGKFAIGKKISGKNLDVRNFFVPLHSQNDGVVAQVVEQWTENPCVAGSTPADTTAGNGDLPGSPFFYYLMPNTYIQVILPLRLEWEPFYATEAELAVGDRVAVPFAGREYIGVVSVTDVTPTVPPGRSTRSAFGKRA